MEYYLVTICTSYSVEEFLIPVDEDVELATDKALASIAFCEDYEIVNYFKVDQEYLDSVKKVRQDYFNLTGDKVEDVFTCGKYANLEDVLLEIMDIRKRKGLNNGNKKD